ncbi:hypothetical protein KFK09_002055 [Dendrobium nobile]|uniref:Uncharacterized protein n=1 Tax=Dendrobium nobile TaxID=94219 RepID=A0A8T3C6U9_DENNO|nr:hypothetical protein KFK09_002055 [Dendrobium nobile]
MEEEIDKLHIVMVPWLAMGHLLPFFELSKSLALKGLQISFFTTPSNIHRLPSIPKTLTPLFKFIPCSSSTMIIENTSDLHYDDNMPLLHQTYDDLEHHLVSFLSDPSHCKPNWIIYDIKARNWAPALASRYSVNSAFFSIFNAAAIAFVDRFRIHDSPEKLATASDHIPFPTTVTFRRFEALRIRPILSKKIDNPSNEMILTRTFREFEGKWIDLLGENCIPVGFLPSSIDEEESETWRRISKWLDQQKEQSVIYVAFGSEAILTREHIDEIALGLEKSDLPFLWVLRVGLPPEGFVERIGERGLVWMGWVPQSRLLAHRAIGGFLTHGGWSSVVEGMVVGAAMAVLPMKYEQGLTARHLVESGYAVEIVRNDEDGYFSAEEIARKLRILMVEEEGEEVRKKARAGKEIFGSKKLQDEYITELVKNLWQRCKMSGKSI